MTESEMKEPELPPFSFSKKPVSSVHSNHSAISDIIPSSSTVRSSSNGNHTSIDGRSSNDTRSGNLTGNDSTSHLYNNINYDEQIRAPRMNTVNYYTYQTNTRKQGGGSISSYRKDSSESKENLSTPSTTANTSPSNEAKMSGTTSDIPSNDDANLAVGSASSAAASPDVAVAGSDTITNTHSSSATDSNNISDQYLPANFDLTQPTRRFSAPSNANTSESPKTTILNYTTNNYIYERNQGPRKVLTDEDIYQNQFQQAHPQPSAQISQSQQLEDPVNKDKLLKALDNLKNNTTTRERQQSASSTGSTGSSGSQNSNRIKNRTSNLTNHHHLSDRNGTDLQQVYELKKPLCVPAVLRPIASNTHHDDNEHNNNTTNPHLGINTLSPTSTRPTTPGDFLHSPTLDLSTPPTSFQPMSKYNELSNQNSPTTPYIDIKAYPFPSVTGTMSISPTGQHEGVKLDYKMQPTEPTHEHWKPNNYTSHCMKCFDPFGNFFTPQRKRRHHCRFCGLIFCFDCLWQIETDSAGSTTGVYIATNRLTRSISNGSMNHSQQKSLNHSTSNPNLANSTPNIASLDGASVGGVLLDAEAKFVIPKFQQIQKSGLSLQVGEYYKFCKVCKDCGNKYQGLVSELNSNDDLKSSAPFLFIENPYIQHNKRVGASSGLGASLHNTVDSRQKLIERGRQMSEIKESDLPETRGDFDAVQKSQISNVPSDWSWSSF